MNEIRITKEKYNEFLNLFPSAWHERLRVYTGEELFYVYKICRFKPGKSIDSDPCVSHDKSYCKDCGIFKSGDLTIASIRAKTLRYLRGGLDEWSRPLRPVPMPLALGKLGRRFKQAFESEIESMLDSLADQAKVEAIDRLIKQTNGQRIA